MTTLEEKAKEMAQREPLPTRPGRYLLFGFRTEPPTDEQLAAWLKAYSGWSKRTMPETHVAGGFLWGIIIPIKKGNPTRDHAERIVRLLRQPPNIAYGYTEFEMVS